MVKIKIVVIILKILVNKVLITQKSQKLKKISMKLLKVECFAKSNLITIKQLAGNELR